LLYVCDRVNDRIQVFKKDGTFMKEVFIAKRTLGDGSVWDIAFSKDPQQKYIYLADGANEKVYVMLRDTLEILTSFGDGGRQPGPDHQRLGEDARRPSMGFHKRRRDRQRRSVRLGRRAVRPEYLSRSRDRGDVTAAFDSEVRSYGKAGEKFRSGDADFPARDL